MEATIVSNSRGGVKNTGGNQAFTLLELMVVIAILASLAALLLPVLSNATRRAKEVACVSNLSQQGVALQSYLSEHHHYPLAVNLKAEQRTWHARILKDRFSDYRADEGVFDCPAQDVPPVFQQVSSGFDDYGYNARGLGGRKFDDSLGLGGHGVSAGSMAPPVKSGEVENAAGMIAIGDGVQGWGNAYEDGTWLLERSRDAVERPGQAEKRAQANAAKRVKARHSGALNILFCDGHVDRTSLITLFHDTTDEALSLWNRDGKAHKERLNGN